MNHLKINSKQQIPSEEGNLQEPVTPPCVVPQEPKAQPHKLPD
jgi:hypothetical protein